MQKLGFINEETENVNRYSPIKVAVTGHHTCHQGKSMLAEYIYIGLLAKSRTDSELVFVWCKTVVIMQELPQRIQYASNATTMTS